MVSVVQTGPSLVMVYQLPRPSLAPASLAGRRWSWVAPLKRRHGVQGDLRQVEGDRIVAFFKLGVLDHDQQLARLDAGDFEPAIAALIHGDCFIVAFNKDVVGRAVEVVGFVERVAQADDLTGTAGTATVRKLRSAVRRPVAAPSVKVVTSGAVIVTTTALDQASSVSGSCVSTMEQSPSGGGVCR